MNFQLQKDKFQQNYDDRASAPFPTPSTIPYSEEAAVTVSSNTRLTSQYEEDTPRNKQYNSDRQGSGQRVVPASFVGQQEYRARAAPSQQFNRPLQPRELTNKNVYFSF